MTSYTPTDFDERLTSLEDKVDSLITTIEEAMILFSHSESSQHIEQTDRRFQSTLKSLEGITSRYSGTTYAAWGVEG